MPPLFSESMEEELEPPPPRWPLRKEDEHGQERVKKRENFRVVPAAPSKGLLEGVKHAFFQQHHMPSSGQARARMGEEERPSGYELDPTGGDERRVQKEEEAEGTH